MEYTNYNKEYALEYLEYSSSKEMNVDGSGTPVIFSHDIPEGEKWFLECVTFFIIDPGTMAYNVFGGLGAALTNGIDIRITKCGTNYDIRSIKDNSDILMTFNHNINTGSTATAFLNEEDYFCGSLDFREPMKLCGDESDGVKIRIRDDLTGIQRIRATATLWKEL